MFDKSFRIVPFIFMLIILACSNSVEKPIIQFSKDSTSIEIVGIKKDGYTVLENRYHAGESLLGLISVVESSGENSSSSMEREISGTISVEDDKLRFIPDSAFESGKEYIVFTFIDVSFGSANEMIRSKFNTKARPWQRTLYK